MFIVSFRLSPKKVLVAALALGVVVQFPNHTLVVLW